MTPHSTHPSPAAPRSGERSATSRTLRILTKPALALGVLCLAWPSSLRAQPAKSDAGAPKGSLLVDAGVSPPAVALDGGRTPSTPASTTVTRPSKPAMDGSSYAVRLRDLEQRVEELKRQIRQSQSRLSMLSESIVGDAVSGSRTEIVVRNEMSSAYKLHTVRFRFGGATVYDRTDDSGSLSDQKEIPVYSGSLSPGDHRVEIDLVFKGSGFGVFSYLRSYNFTVKSSRTFTAIEGKVIQISAVAYEQGGVTVPLEQRPTIRWVEQLKPLTVAPRDATKPAAPAAPAKPTATPAASGGKR